MNTSLSTGSNELFAKNFKFLCKRMGFTHEELAKRVGGSRSSVTSYGRGAIPRQPKLDKLLGALGVTMNDMFYTDLTLEQGDDKSGKFFSINSKINQPLQSNVAVFKSAAEDNGAEVYGPVVAAAGYTQMPEIEEGTLSTFRLPFLSHGKNYWGFIIQGYSMQNIPPGTFMVGEVIEDWHSIKSGTPCIIEVKNTYKSGEGIVLKLVYNHIREQGVLELRSTNPDYETYTVPVKEIRRIWKIDGFYTRDFPGIAS